MGVKPHHSTYSKAIPVHNLKQRTIDWVGVRRVSKNVRFHITCALFRRFIIQSRVSDAYKCKGEPTYILNLHYTKFLSQSSAYTLKLVNSIKNVSELVLYPRRQNFQAVHGPSSKVVLKVGIQLSLCLIKDHNINRYMRYNKLKPQQMEVSGHLHI